MYMPPVRSIRGIKLMAAIALSIATIGFAAHPAQAGLIVVSHRADFTSTPVTITLGAPSRASYTFSYLGFNPDDPTYSVDAVATGGTATVNSSAFPGPGQQPIPFEIDALIGPGSGYPNFTQFPAPAPIAYSIAEDFIGLRFTLKDGTHYGYAEVDGPILVRYAYQTTPGAGIVTGQTVPEPASLLLLVIGAACAMTSRRRTKMQQP